MGDEGDLTVCHRAVCHDEQPSDPLVGIYIFFVLFVYMYIYIYTFFRIYIRVYVYTYIHVYIIPHQLSFAYTYPLSRVHHTRTHARTHAYMHARTRHFPVFVVKRNLSRSCIFSPRSSCLPFFFFLFLPTRLLIRIAHTPVEHGTTHTRIIIVPYFVSN